MVYVLASLLFLICLYGPFIKLLEPRQNVKCAIASSFLPFNFVFDLRQAGDYDYEAKMTKEDAQTALEIATLFLTKTKDLLG